MSLIVTEGKGRRERIELTFHTSSFLLLRRDVIHFAKEDPPSEIYVSSIVPFPWFQRRRELFD